MKYSKVDLKALGRTAKAVLFAGATTLASGATPAPREQALSPEYRAFPDSATSLTSPTPLIIRGQVFSSVDGFPVDTNNPGYAKIISVRRPGLSSGDSCVEWADGTSRYSFNHLNFSPELDRLDTLDILVTARDYPDYKCKLAFVADSALPVVRYPPPVFFDSPNPPYETLKSFGVTFMHVDTSNPRVAGKGLEDKVIAIFCLQKDTSKKCTGVVYDNGRGSYPAYADLVKEIGENLKTRIDDGDSLIVVLSAALDSVYEMDTTLALITQRYGTEVQAQLFDTLKFIPERVYPLTGIKEENVQRPKENEPATSSRVTTISRLQQLIEDEKRKGNDPRLYDALGQKRSACEPGVNFLETTGRGRNMGKNRNGGRIVSKFVISSNGRRRNTPMH